MDRLLLDGIYVNPLSHQFSLSLHLRPWKIAGSIMIPGVRYERHKRICARSGGGGSARMIWAAISPSLSSAKENRFAGRVIVAAQNGLAHQVFGCGAFFSLKAAQVALQPLGVGSIEKVALAPSVHKLTAWRKRNRLSQRAAVAVLQKYYFHLTFAWLRSWEEDRRSPHPHTAAILEKFLNDHPTVPPPK